MLFLDKTTSDPLVLPTNQRGDRCDATLGPRVAYRTVGSVGRGVLRDGVCVSFAGAEFIARSCLALTFREFYSILRSPTYKVRSSDASSPIHQNNADRPIRQTSLYCGSHDRYSISLGGHLAVRVLLATASLLSPLESSR